MSFASKAASDLQLMQSNSNNVAAKAPSRASFETAATAEEEEEEDDDDEPFKYWMEYGWVPRTKSGKQRTPNMIRNELQKYIDASTETQTAIVAKMGVHSNSFRNFMDPGSYKNQWSALQNGTYWAAAQLLEEERNKPKQSNKKRKAATSSSNNNDNDPTNKKSKSQAKLDAVALMNRIASFDAPGLCNTMVYDSCPDLVRKLKSFLDKDGVTKTDLCRYGLGGIQMAQLNRFLAAKKQDAAGTGTYTAAWVFFEKYRLLQGNQPKSKQRLQNEVKHPHGFDLRKESKKKHRIYIPRGWLMK